MSKGELTKARLIETTADLIASQGYHATGLNQITHESGTPMGSLYYHFRGGKDELVAAALLAGGEAITQAMRQVFPTADSLPAALRALVGILTEQLQTSDYRKGCPIATVILETAAQNDALQSTAQAIYREWQTEIADFLVKAGWLDERAAALAQFALTVIEGGLLLSRAERSIAPLEQASAHLIRFIQTDETNPHKG